MAVLVDTTHTNCHFSHIHEVSLLFQDILLSSYENPATATALQ
jgi:hypothetical protein